MSSTQYFSSSALILPSKPASNLTKSSFHGLRFANPNPVKPISSSVVGCRRSSGVVTIKMAKKDEELKEFRVKSNEELNDEILQLKGELFMLRLRRSAREDFKPSDFRILGKRVARMLTVKREREIEEGIGKRLSRKLDKEWKRNVVVKPPPSLLKLQEEKAVAEAN